MSEEVKELKIELADANALNDDLIKDCEKYLKRIKELEGGLEGRLEDARVETFRKFRLTKKSAVGKYFAHFISQVLNT